MITVSRLLVAVFVLSLLEACSLAPRYERPEFDMPKSWRKVDLGTTPLNVDWWNRFNDPTLTRLIEEALTKNQDLASSMAKIRQAAAQAGVSSADLFPQVTGSGTAEAKLASNRTANTNYDSSGLTQKYTNYQGIFSASWELDFWGKNFNSYKMLTEIGRAHV